MEEMNHPIYAIEHFFTYCNAVWMYEDSGIDSNFVTENPGETIAKFMYEQDARDYFKKYKCNEMEFYDPMDYEPESPDIGIGYYLLVRYDNWNDEGTVLLKSQKGITARQMRNLFKKSGIDLKELMNEQASKNKTICN